MQAAREFACSQQDRETTGHNNIRGSDLGDVVENYERNADDCVSLLSRDHQTSYLDPIRLSSCSKDFPGHIPHKQALLSQSFTQSPRTPQSNFQRNGSFLNRLSAVIGISRLFQSRGDTTPFFSLLRRCRALHIFRCFVDYVY
jgi:hypothetical protein